MEKTIKLCCGKGCPSITLKDKKVTIVDDLGNKVTISLEEADLIPNALKELKKCSTLQ